MSQLIPCHDCTRKYKQHAPPTGKQYMLTETITTTLREFPVPDTQPNMVIEKQTSKKLPQNWHPERACRGLKLSRGATPVHKHGSGKFRHSRCQLWYTIKTSNSLSVLGTVAKTWNASESNSPGSGHGVVKWWKSKVLQTATTHPATWVLWQLRTTLLGYLRPSSKNGQPPGPTCLIEYTTTQELAPRAPAHRRRIGKKGPSADHNFTLAWTWKWRKNGPSKRNSNSNKHRQKKRTTHQLTRLNPITSNKRLVYFTHPGCSICSWSISKVKLKNWKSCPARRCWQNREQLSVVQALVLWVYVSANATVWPETAVLHLIFTGGNGNCRVPCRH